MAFREVSVVQMKELLRLWLKGAGERTVAQSVGVDRKTVRRYLEAAKASTSIARAVKIRSPTS